MVTRGGLQAAGVSVDLTPPAGHRLGGYMLREGASATSAHDPLEGSLVWVRDATGGEILWVALDALAVDERLAATIAESVGRAAGCDPRAVLVCASHTHSSAAGWFESRGPFLRNEAEPSLRADLVERLADAARSLPAGLEPVRPCFGEGQAPAAGGNRNDPAGPHDDSVGTLALVDADGRVAVVVVDFASHATVLGHANLAWSADWPGAARRVIADGLERLAPFATEGAAKGLAGRRPTVAFLQGAAGDASPRFARRGQTFGEVDRLGGVVGAAALEAILQGRPDQQSEGGPLGAGVQRTSVPISTRRLPSPEDARSGAARAEEAWRSAVRDGVPAPEERIARTGYEGALVLVTLAETGLEPTLELRASVATLGDAAWVHLPVELFASYGLAIRAASPFAWTRVIGYTDGYLGYVADEVAHRNGVYEASSSSFDTAGGEEIAAAAIDLLRAAASGRTVAAVTGR